MIPRSRSFSAWSSAALAGLLWLAAVPSLSAQFVLDDPTKDLAEIEIAEQLLDLSLPGTSGEVPMDWNYAVTPILLGTTGNLGFPVTDGLTPHQLTVNTPIVAPSTQLIVSITYGLWNSPDVNVTASFNGVTLGSFVADNAFISVGPRTIQFNVSGSSLLAANVISFIGDSTGDYVISQVDIHAVPEPSTWALLGLGLGAIAFARWRRRTA